MSEAESVEALARARAALAKGRLRASVRHGWTAGLASIHDRDSNQLGAVLDLAKQIEEQASGRMRKRAEVLSKYCSAALADGLENAGQARGHWLGWLLGRRTKRCPDCAETIQADARVCRFCGYRF